jgi:hypothetical protein
VTKEKKGAKEARRRGSFGASGIPLHAQRPHRRPRDECALKRPRESQSRLPPERICSLSPLRRVRSRLRRSRLRRKAARRGSLRLAARARGARGRSGLRAFGSGDPLRPKPCVAQAYARAVDSVRCVARGRLRMRPPMAPHSLTLRAAMAEIQCAPERHRAANASRESVAACASWPAIRPWAYRRSPGRLPCCPRGFRARA